MTPAQVYFDVLEETGWHALAVEAMLKYIEDMKGNEDEKRI